MGRGGTSRARTGTTRKRTNGWFTTLALRNILLGAFLINCQFSAISVDAKLQIPPQHLLERRDFVEPHPSKPFIVKNAFIAEFKTMPGDMKGVETDHEGFRNAVKDGQYNIRERLALKSLLNAISFEATTETANRIASLPMIKSVWPMVAQNRPRIQEHSVPNVQGLKFAHAMTGVDRVRQRLQKSGEGVKVGVVDSGIDYTHPALGGCFGAGCRVAYGWDLVGDDYTGNGRSQPVPDADPRDTCNGHGTHVAGIIGANDPSFQGVAPEVTLGAYRVFGCKGSSETDVVIAGMERAHQDGMQVINMSLGGGSSWSEYPDAAAAERLARLGVVVVASMGNDGDKGMWEASSPGLAPSVIAVGSVDSMKYQAFGLRVDNEQLPPMEYLSDKETPLDFKSVSIVSAQTPNDSVGLGCEKFATKLTGKLLLVQRGNCTFNVKAENAKEAGAIGVLVYNNVPDDVFIPSVTSPNSIPVVGLAQANGQRIQKLLAQKQSATVTFPNSLLTFDNPNGGHMSRFSSYGPGPELEVKPDITAPGGLIRSTYPVPMGGYRTLSGTSMSSPYVAGAAALYLSVKGKVPNAPTEIRQMFQATAKAITHTNQADSGLASVVRQGAGLLDIDAAIKSVSLVTPSRIGLNDSQHGNLDGTHSGSHTVTITISNTKAIPVEYAMHHTPSMAIQGYTEGHALKKPELRNDHATVNISKINEDDIDELSSSDKKNEEHNTTSNNGGTIRHLVGLPRRSREHFSTHSRTHRFKLTKHTEVNRDASVPSVDDNNNNNNSDDADDVTESEDATNMTAPPSHTDTPITKFTVPGNGEVAVTLTIHPPNLPVSERWIYSGFLEFYGSNHDMLHVPYMGLSGNLHAQPILDRNGFPYLTKFVAEAGVGKMKQKALRHNQHTTATIDASNKPNHPLSEEDTDLDMEAVEDEDVDTGDVTSTEEQDPRMSFSVENTDFNDTIASSTIPVLHQDNKASRLKLRVRLMHPTRVLRVDIMQIMANDPQQAGSIMANSKLVGILPNAWITYLGRHSEDNDDFATDFAFDGTYTPLNMASKTLFMPNQQNVGGALGKGVADADHNANNAGGKVVTLPDGYYRLKVLALMPFGDENQTNDWDTWTSPLLRLSTQAGSHKNANDNSNNNSSNSDNNGGTPLPRESPNGAADQQTLPVRKVEVIQEKQSMQNSAGVERQFRRVQSFKSFRKMISNKHEGEKSWDGHVTI